MAAKEVRFSEDARLQMVRGVNVQADASGSPVLRAHLLTQFAP
jgi:hypothetical protein